jgi:4'-phosphopantetheinyl transferase
MMCLHDAGVAGAALHAHWARPAEPPRLGPCDAHVWRARVDLGPVALEPLRNLLDDDERRRADRFVFAHDRERFVVSHARLRQVLGAYTGAAPASLQFAVGPYGKPHLASPASPAGLEFNMSHAGDLVLVAVTLGRAIGVDVERVRPDYDYSAVLGSVLSAPERAAFAALPADRRRQFFYATWTQKEALVKASGRGLSQPLDSFSAGDTVRLEGEAWALRALDPGAGYAGYAGALAVAGDVARLCLFAWD